VNHWMPATGILTKLPVACLKPAAGAMLRQAPPTKPRAGEKRPSRSEYQTHNPGRARDRQQVPCLPSGKRELHFPAPGVFFVRSAVLGEHQQSHSRKAKEET
jgi:hypothetical protein